MTYIRDLDDVRTDRRRRAPTPDPLPSPPMPYTLGVVVVTGLAVLTGLNLWVSSRLYETSKEVVVLKQQLGELTAFEKRISEKIDRVNVGLQSQFDRLTTTVASRVDDATSTIDRVESTLGAVKQSISDQQLEVASVGPSTTLADALEAPQKMPRVVRRKSEQPRKTEEPQIAEAPPRMSSDYVRVESADGKLTYKKVR